MSERQIDAITGYHAHVYYSADSRREAEGLRDAVATHFPGAVLGRWHDRPIGPHPCPSYQIAFEVPLFATLVPWLALNRGALDLLVHPLTGDELADHRDYAFWLGRSYSLDLSALK